MFQSIVAAARRMFSLPSGADLYGRHAREFDRQIAEDEARADAEAELEDARVTRRARRLSIDLSEAAICEHMQARVDLLAAEADAEVARARVDMLRDRVSRLESRVQSLEAEIRGDAPTALRKEAKRA